MSKFRTGDEVYNEYGHVARYVLPADRRLAIHMLGNAVPPPMTAAVITELRRVA